MKLADGRDLTFKELQALTGKVEAYGRDLTLDDITLISEERCRLKEGLDSSTPLSENYQLIGLCGERYFSEVTGLPMNINVSGLDGDGGVDFLSKLGTIDVKTYAKPFNLLRKVNKHPDKCAEILVLLGYETLHPYARLIGWEYDRMMVIRPTSDRFGLFNYFKPAGKLRAMPVLFWCMWQAGDRTPELIELARRA